MTEQSEQKMSEEKEKSAEQVSLFEESKAADKPAKKADRKKDKPAKAKETAPAEKKEAEKKDLEPAKKEEAHAEGKAAGRKKEAAEKPDAEPAQKKSAEKDDNKPVTYDDADVADLAKLTVLSKRGDHQQFCLGADTEIRYGEKSDIHQGVMTLDWQDLGSPQFMIHQSGKRWYFTNANLSNETWLNKKAIDNKERVEIFNGDLITIVKDTRILCMLFEDHWDAETEWRSCLLINKKLPISFYSSEALHSMADLEDEKADSSKELPHATFLWRNGRWNVEDHGIKKAIYINSTRIENAAPIDIYDCIHIGDSYYVYMPGRLIYSLKGSIRKELIVSLKDRTVKTSFKHEKVLLKDINLTIKPGELVLLLGGSGAGKTTLINAITGYEQANAKVLNGGVDVYANYSQMKYDIAVVPQQDLLRGTDNVYNTLYNAAELRMPVSYTKEEKKKRVEEVLDEFGLQAQRGSLVKSLSGGQRKRLSIACEFIGNPSLFILDEPDSGLDGVIAKELMERLRKIADSGKIVIVITHTPDRVIEQFDHIIVLAKDSKKTGRLVYYGPIDEAKKFFGKEKMEDIVKSINTKEEGGEGRADELIEKYQQQRKNGGNENA